jgi:peptide/nickel transport system permease protein
MAVPPARATSIPGAEAAAVPVRPTALRPPIAEQFGEFWFALRRNPTAMIGLFLVGLVIFSALFAGIVAPYPANQVNLAEAAQAPNSTYWFGTDQFGQDIFSRILYGARVDLTIALSAVVISLLIGSLYGAVSAYVGGLSDEVAMRGMDILQGFPRFIFAMGIAYALGPGVKTVVIATSVLNIPGYARLMRASMLSAKTSQYAMAAKAIGAGHRAILFRHLVPNCLVPIFVISTLQFGWAILEAAGLSFIGLGVETSRAEWGAMIQLGFQDFLQGHWWMYTFPGLAIAITVLGFNLIGDGLQDILDPRRR